MSPLISKLIGSFDSSTIFRCYLIAIGKSQLLDQRPA